MGTNGVQLRTLEDTYRFCKALAGTSFVPQAYRNRPMEMMAAIQYGLEIGLTPMESLRSVDVINGNPGLRTNAEWGLVMRKAKEYEDHWHEFVGEEGTDNWGCRVWIKRKGCEPRNFTFTVAMAKRAGKWGGRGVWSEYPERMLYHRAAGFLIDTYFPHVTKGMVNQEVSQDWPTGTDQVEPEKPPEREAEIITEGEKTEVEQAAADFIEAAFGIEKEEKPAVEEDPFVAGSVVHPFTGATVKDEPHKTFWRTWGALKDRGEDPTKWFSRLPEQAKDEETEMAIARMQKRLDTLQKKEVARGAK